MTPTTNRPRARGRRSLLGVALVLIAAVGAPPRAARATVTPSIAVMPFRDLSGQARGSIGEAIRETVTTDLKEVPGLRVIERSNIDKILAEQNLQGSRTDLDPLSTVKVGKLLGASLIVAGAYQRSSQVVRLTARFVKVETGEIVGTAKVDGPAADFLTLQDKVTSELLRSAGIEQRQVQHFARRPRPKLRSLRPVELYGDAVVEKDDERKRTMLRAVVNEDPGFVYAARDLDELEKRLKAYDANYQREADKEVRALREQIKSEKDPTKLMMAYTQAFGKLAMQRRFRALLAFGRETVKNPPPAAPPPYPNLVELAQMYVVTSLQSMRDYDSVLREGERFLSQYPTSMYFASIRAQMDQAIEHKRAVAEGATEARDELAKLESKEKGDPCVVGRVYHNHKQWREARSQLELCLAGGRPTLPKGTVYTLLVTAAMEQGEFGQARRFLEALRGVDPQLHRSMSSLEMAMPADG